MSGVWQQAIVRVLRCVDPGTGASGAVGPDGAEVIGTGVLVATPQYGPCVLTAAHVVNTALGFHRSATQAPDPDLLIPFDLPAKGVGPDRTHLARVIEWAPPRPRVMDPVSDIALLQVVHQDGGAALGDDLRLYSPEDFEVLTDEALEKQGDLFCFGFARSGGAFARGRVSGIDAPGWLHLVGSGEGDFIAPGFSGAPAFDHNRRRILGMAVAVDGQGERLAFLQSTRNLWQACPELARPYRGLRAFEEEDAPFFFGREGFVARMLEKTARHPLLGVTAASGSGKSSAIRAGLVPQLKADGRTLVVAMRPADNPWKELAKGLQAYERALLSPETGIFAADDRADEMAQRLRERPQKLKDYARALLDQASAGHLVIFVDQFEELFTLAGHEREAEAKPDGEATEGLGMADRADFRDLMVATARLSGAAHEPRVQWLYALRGDFADRAFKHPGFTACVGDGNVMLADMTKAELCQAIEKPAAALGVAFEGGTAQHPGLVGRIARDAGMTAGALPLMQHVLEQLWRGMRERLLTHEAYGRLGGLRGALDRHADQVFEALSPEEQGLARRLFSRLVNVEETGEVTRRVARQSELGEGLWAVAVRLAGEDSRLLTLRGTRAEPGSGSARDPAGIAPGDETAEVAHEARQRNWGRLQGWVREDLRFLLWRRRFEQQMSDFAYLTGGPLQVALGWLEERPDDLTPAEQAYIRASRTRQEKEEEKRQRQHDLEAALATAEAERERAEAARIEAEAQRERAETARSEAEAERERAEDDAARYAAAIADGLNPQGRSVEALKVVRASLKETFSPEDLARKSAAYAMLAQSLARIEQDPSILRGHSSGAKAAWFSSDGTRIVTASDDYTARLWDAASGRVLAILEGHSGGLSEALFSPDGTRIVTASDDSTARLWHVLPASCKTATAGKLVWTTHPPFSRVLLERADFVAPHKLTEDERRTILQEDDSRDRRDAQEPSKK